MKYSLLQLNKVCVELIQKDREKMNTNIFENFDFSLLSSPDFKEDSVREVLIKPFLNALGYSASGKNKIIRSKGLTNPYVNLGSKRKKIRLIPDYLLEVGGKYAWVLDAKSPDESVQKEDYIEQIYSYAIHPDVRVDFYALCNGKEFILFKMRQREAVLYFQLSEIEHHWRKIKTYLSPNAFEKEIKENGVKRKYSHKAFDYLSATPPREIKDLKKQSAKRHYGVHGYFTKQVWNVVQEYIKTFTQPGDVVLDPFGGSGVTAIEALILGRKSINIDINPLSVFIVESLMIPINISKFTDEYRRIKKTFEENAPRTKHEIEIALEKYPYPKGITLPRKSDVDKVEKLFSSEQIAQLAYLKYIIKQVPDNGIQKTFLLMFSGLLSQINLTFHASKGRTAGRGNNSMFQYYRYRIAPKPSMLDVVERLELRFRSVLAAKKEISTLLQKEQFKNFKSYKGSATNLYTIEDESVDYIYTDPPYGAKIPYLDLSTMWNAWLDLPVEKEDFDLEVIEGGDQKKKKQDYSNLLSQSISEMFRVLKCNRWMSFVFAHKDPQLWHMILDAAEKAGFEYVNAVKQSNAKTTYKKRQNPFTVLSGQLIINFKKVQNPKTVLKVDLGADIADIVMQTIEGIIAKNEGATLEEINDELIIRGLELGFLDILSKQYQDISPLLAEYFDYDEETKNFHIRQDTKFRSKIDERLRIRYYLISYLRRKEREGVHPTFDEIVLHIMPLLKNGKTPENQTILSVLNEIAIHMGADRWGLKDISVQPYLL